MTLGSSLPGLILEDKDGQKATPEEIKNFLTYQAIAISVCLGISILGLRNKPAIPPSRSAENQHKNKNNYSETIKKLFKNK